MRRVNNGRNRIEQIASASSRDVGKVVTSSLPSSDLFLTSNRANRKANENARRKKKHCWCSSTIISPLPFRSLGTAELGGKHLFSSPCQVIAWLRTFDCTLSFRYWSREIGSVCICWRRKYWYLLFSFLRMDYEEKNLAKLEKLITRLLSFGSIFIWKAIFDAQKQMDQMTEWFQGL